MSVVQIPNFQGSKFINWHQCHCDQPGCKARGPIRASAESAIAKAVQFGWRQVGNCLACAQCVLRLAEVGAATIAAAAEGRKPFAWPSQAARFATQQAEGE